ncbi:prenyltransferase [Rubripirellula reticaptiva]|uniref:Prenyltransferase n=1 Tax=Rubripirellula reticaptiva TaxID=2528013 RepID=A0A5C6F804_9BACT|nr:prenyltransferase [Rubripirellula reticaptiva]
MLPAPCFRASKVVCDSLSSSTSPASAPGPSSSSRSTLFHWAQLVRLPNVFTVLADVSAAFLLVAHGPTPLPRFLAVVIAGVALYWAGMILNDVFDVVQDKAQRSTRPLAAGAIPISQAKFAGWLLLGLGVAIGAASGYLPGGDSYPVTWFPAAISVLLAIMIVAYDGPLKKTPLAPMAMGGCRVLSFLLGASPLFALTIGQPPFPQYVVGIAMAFGVYIMGLTTMARREAVGGPSHNLPMGLIVTVLGCVMLAFAPQLARGANMGWTVSTRDIFPLMMGTIAFPVVVRAIRAVRTPTPMNIQMAIRVGILSVIPLAAAYAYLGAGSGWALAIFALVVPSMILGTRLRVT